MIAIAKMIETIRNMQRGDFNLTIWANCIVATSILSLPKISVLGYIAYNIYIIGIVIFGMIVVCVGTHYGYFEHLKRH